MNYDIFGPFEVPIQPNGLISHKQADFWGSIEDSYPGLSAACGCYMFCASSAGGDRKWPWYVGQANKSSFKSECFKPQKINHYNEVIVPYERVRAWMYLVPRLTDREKFCKPSVNGRSDIDKLEDLLIGLAVRANHGTRNSKGAKVYREMKVPGVLNSKPRRPKKSVVQLKKSLGIK